MNRLKKLKNILRKSGTLPYFITSLINIEYLTGFKGTNAFLLIDKDRYFFITDSRYEEYAKNMLNKRIDFILQKKEFTGTLKKIVKELNCKKIYLEEHSITLSSFHSMKSELKGIKLESGGDRVNEIRIIKNEDEIAIIQKAVRIADDCFNHLLGFIKPGMLEWDIAVEIEYYYRKHGCTKTSFDSIVASGTGSSMPHYSTSMTKKVKKNEPLLIDMGCVYQGYNSDLTRTIFLNSIAPEFKKIYNTVKDAQVAALKFLKPGVTSGSADKTARDVITKAGYGDAFGHSLGHGVGLEVHELPALKPGGDFRLKKNMVVTVEPGIYLNNFGGVRIEDMVLISSGGSKILTSSPKDIIII